MTVIQVPDVLYERILARAEQLMISPEALATQAVQEYLWRSDFDALMEKTRARAMHLAPEEIEADITAASEEVRQNRATHRSD